ncbi:MAG: preprotein translocase subunit SecG [Deltaproteobacteria bacterium]|nr:preprotein translocase subunit SecG [Deltaproteobacteria bacterium]
METLLSILHYFLCFFLIVTILLQAGKGADIGAAFGAGGSQTVFGPRGAGTFLSKVTTAVAILFLLTSIGLSKLSRPGLESVFEKEPVETQAQKPLRL